MPIDESNGRTTIALIGQKVELLTSLVEQGFARLQDSIQTNKAESNKRMDKFEDKQESLESNLHKTQETINGIDIRLKSIEKNLWFVYTAVGALVISLIWQLITNQVNVVP